MKYESPTAQMLKDTADKFARQINQAELYLHGMKKTDESGTVELFN